MPKITVTIDADVFHNATVACSYARESVRGCPDLVKKYDDAYGAMIEAAVIADLKAQKRAARKANKE